MYQKKSSDFLPYLLTIILLFFIFFISSCSVLQVAGLGKVVSEERQISGIESISTGSSINLVIEQTGTEYLRIETTENIISNITTEVVNGELKINLKTEGFIGIRPIDCFVSVKDINAIRVSSKAQIFHLLLR